MDKKAVTDVGKGVKAVTKKYGRKQSVELKRDAVLNAYKNLALDAQVDVDYQAGQIRSAVRSSGQQMGEKGAIEAFGKLAMFLRVLALADRHEVGLITYQMKRTGLDHDLVTFSDETLPSLRVYVNYKIISVTAVFSRMTRPEQYLFSIPDRLIKSNTEQELEKHLPEFSAYADVMAKAVCDAWRKIKARQDKEK